jgi:ankyrin repeat protein
VGNREAVSLLLGIKEGRETLHLLDSASYSPLVSALMHGQRDIVTYLLAAESGVTLDIDAKDAQGRAAIHYAAEGGKVDALKLLLEYRADINAKEITTGSTALHIASGYLDLLSLFSPSPH